MTVPWKTAWITGASTGIGRELAIQLAADGVRVAASARSADKLNELARDHRNILAVPVDVTVRADVAAAHRHICEALGGVDLAILNAGVWHPMPASTYDAARVVESMNINYVGIAHALEPLIAAMVASGHGQLALVASVAGYRGLPKAAAYAPSKAAVISLAEVLRLELARHGIVVSLVNPGFIETPMTAVNEFPMPYIMMPSADLELVPSELWMFDRDTDTPIDINPTVEGEQGLSFTSSVLGIEALRREHLQTEYTDDSLRTSGRSIAVVLANSRVVFAHEETGCLVQDNLGPRTEVTTTGLTGPGDYEPSFSSTPQPATLELAGSSGRHVSVNACAGIAPSESWELRYDQNRQGWEVEGTLSGLQSELAREDERYLSDNGEISFVIRAGVTASRDGWTISFNVLGGAAEATGDNDLDGVSEFVLGIAADPVYFEYRVGQAGPIGSYEGEGWLPVDIRPFVLVPAASSDTVLRVDPQEAQLETGWK